MLRIRPVPPSLKPYIDIANVLPAPERLPGSEDRRKFPGVELPDWPILSILEAWSHDPEYIQILIDRFPPFREFMAGAQLDEAFPSEAWRRCCQLHEVRSVLYTIARRVKKERSGLRLTIPAGFDKAVTVYSNQSGTLQLELHPFLKALIDVEIARIRECPICGNVYWAGRIDKPSCSSRCDNALRQQRWRDGYPEKYKLQRIARAEAEER